MVAGSSLGADGPKLETVSLADFPDVVIATHFWTVTPVMTEEVQVFGEVVTGTTHVAFS